MDYTYEVITTELGVACIQRTESDGKVWSIPVDPANSDYQRYLKDTEESTEL